MGVVLPTLTLDGWISHPPVMLKKIFDYFQVVDSDSSVAFFGDVHSLDYIIHKHVNDIDGLKTDIHSSLNSILSRYWSEYNVEVNMDRTEKENIYKVIIDISVTVDNINYTLSNNYYTNGKQVDINLDYLITGEM